MKFTGLIVPLLVWMIPAFGQMRENTDPQMSCEATWKGDSERFCEVRETRVAATQRLEVAASPNGGVTVRGWNHPEILVRARVEANALTEAQAKSLANLVNIQVGAGRLDAVGPARNRDPDAWWGVSYEVFVPHRMDLKVTSANGGITIQDVEGDITYTTANGGVNLTRLAGNVRGETRNGGVSLHLPINYSARILDSTQHGGFKNEFPVSGDLGSKKIEFNVGTGGAPIRIATRNGGVSIRKKMI